MAFYHHIHCKYTGIKGFVNLYEYSLKYRYMITEKARNKARTLIFWEKHGLEATLDAFPVKRSTLFLWKKKLKERKGKLESLNDKKRIPKTKRRRIWLFEIRNKIKNIRKEHPNLGSEKIYPLLSSFCKENNLRCPKPRTIARIIADDPEKMRVFPQKISHFSKIKPIKRRKVLRKPKGLKPEYPSHLIALDTIEKIVNGCRRYINPDQFNRKLVDYLIFYNIDRVHWAFQNKLSPVQFMIQWQEKKIQQGQLQNQSINQLIKIPAESKIGWHYTLFCF